MLIRFLASVFGLIFAAFANIGQTHLVFTVNAVSNIHGGYMESLTESFSGCCNIGIYYLAVLSIPTGREYEICRRTSFRARSCIATISAAWRDRVNFETENRGSREF